MRLAHRCVELCLPGFTDNDAIYKYAAGGLFKQSNLSV